MQEMFLPAKEDVKLPFPPQCSWDRCYRREELPSGAQIQMEDGNMRRVSQCHMAAESTRWDPEENQVFQRKSFEQDSVPEVLWLKMEA